MTRAALLLSLIAAAGCAANTCPLAHDVGLECSGNRWYVEEVPNLARVAGPRRPPIYRGGQPVGEEQWSALARLGVTDVLKLNELAEGDDNGAGAFGIRVHHVPLPPSTLRWLSVFEEPSPSTMRELRRVVEQMRASETFTCRPGYEDRCAPQFRRNGWFIHCANGHDRTGFVVMLVRVLLDGWSYGQAYEEFRQWGGHHQIPGLAKTIRKYAR